MIETFIKVPKIAEFYKSMDTKKNIRKKKLISLIGQGDEFIASLIINHSVKNCTLKLFMTLILLLNVIKCV